MGTFSCQTHRWPKHGQVFQLDILKTREAFLTNKISLRGISIAVSNKLTKCAIKLKCCLLRSRFHTIVTWSHFQFSMMLCRDIHMSCEVCAIIWQHLQPPLVHAIQNTRVTVFTQRQRNAAQVEILTQNEKAFGIGSEQHYTTWGLTCDNARFGLIVMSLSASTPRCVMSF